MTDTPPAPERLRKALSDRYRIERELGQGGMATVYLAQDLKHDRKVALKVLKPELAAVVGGDRFLAEIKTTANLQHPNILPLFDSGVVEGQLFYVMPYVEGESLRERLDREKQLPVQEAVRITAEVAEALDHAHRQGVVHRDIKPANILLRDGRPLVADFGIALAVGTAGARLTETGLSLGTPYYMSPEQATGDQGVTPASDIYALGCVLYEMLAGDPPHRAATAQAVLARIITGEVEPVGAARPSVPANVDAALRRALERIPADRFDSARAFAEALRDPGYRYGVERGPAEAGFSWRRAGVFVGLGLIPGLFLGQLLGGGGSEAPDPGASAGERPLQLTFSGQARKPALSPDGAFAAYVEEDCDHGTFGACRHSLRVLEVGESRHVDLLSAVPGIREARWSATGEEVVVSARLGEGREGIFTIPRLGGTPQLVSPPGIFDTHARGDSLVVVMPSETGDAHLGRVVELATGRVADEFTLQLSDPYTVSWSPDGDRLAFVGAVGLTVTDRDGAVLDERRSTALREDVRWNTAGDGLLIFQVGAVREDDLLRFPVARDGSIGEPRLVQGGIPTRYDGQLDVARNAGRLAVSTADARHDIWTFDLTANPVAGERETEGTTWYGLPSRPVAGAIYYLRGDALGDNMHVLDLDTGVEEPLTSQSRPGGSSVRVTRDGRIASSLLTDPSGPVLQWVDFPSRRVRSVQISDSLVRSRPIPLGPGRTLLQSSRSLVVLGDDGEALQHLPELETEHQLTLEMAASPSGDRVVAVLLGERGDLAVGVVGLDGGPWTLLAELPGEELTPGLSWTDDGQILLGRWPASDDRPGIWSLDPVQGTLRKRWELPASCDPESIRVADDASRAVCQLDESRMDIRVFEGLGR